MRCSSGTPNASVLRCRSGLADHVGAEQRDRQRHFLDRKWVGDPDRVQRVGDLRYDS
jgi:hypothetical protein